MAPTRPGVNGVTPTVTYPSHTTLVTGVRPPFTASSTTRPSIRSARTRAAGIGTPRTSRCPTLWDAAGGAGLVDSQRGLAGYRGRTHPAQHPAVLAWPTGRGSQAAARAVHARPARRGRTGPGVYPAGYQYTPRDDATARARSGVDDREEAAGPAHRVFLVARRGAAPLRAVQQATFETLERLDALVGQVRAAAEQDMGTALRAGRGLGSRPHPRRPRGAPERGAPRGWPD